MPDPRIVEALRVYLDDVCDCAIEEEPCGCELRQAGKACLCFLLRRCPHIEALRESWQPEAWTPSVEEVAGREKKGLLATHFPDYDEPQLPPHSGTRTTQEEEWALFNRRAQLKPGACRPVYAFRHPGDVLPTQVDLARAYARLGKARAADADRAELERELLQWLARQRRDFSLRARAAKAIDRHLSRLADRAAENLGERGRKIQRERERVAEKYAERLKQQSWRTFVQPAKEAKREGDKVKAKTFVRKLAKAKLIAFRCAAAGIEPGKWVKAVLEMAGRVEKRRRDSA